MTLRRFLNKRWVSFPLICIGLYFLWEQTHPVWQSWSDRFKGAALGVIVSVAAALIGYWLTRYFDRRVKRYNALCYMELILNCLLTSLSDNQYQIEKALASNEPTLIFPSLLHLSKSDIAEIGRVSLKNRLLNVFIDCEKYGQSLESAISIFERNVQTFKDFQARQFTNPQHIQLILRDYHRQSKSQLKELYDFGQLVNEVIKAALVDVRFFAKNDRPPLIGIGPYYSKRELERWRVKNRQELEKEIAATMAEDEARRSALHGVR